MATPIPTNRAHFTIDAIVEATGGSLVRRGPMDTASVVGVTTDSRAVVVGGAFVALRGENHDGHAFLAGAVSRGAAVVVVERGRGDGLAGDVAIVEVDDTLVAWGELARVHLAAWRAAPCAGARAIVAITGSAGKTTTKELTLALLAAVGPTHATAGNLNNRIGVPAVVFAAEPAHRFLVLEMGMSLPGELDAIASFAKPDVAIVTNVGVAHAEGVGGADGVEREKGAVYRALSAEGISIVNLDDPRVVRAATTSAAHRKETFGRAEAARYRLVSRTPATSGTTRAGLPKTGSDVVIACPLLPVDADGISGGAGRAKGSARELAVHLPIPGEVAALDLCAALAAQEVASGVVLSADSVERALATVHLVGRAVVRALGHDTLLLDDTYNANPASMRAALGTLAEIAGHRRKVAVLGEMKELGPVAEEEHASLGDAIAAAGVRLAIGCGGLVDRALDRAETQGVEVVRAASTLEAAAVATSKIQASDAILVKGSRGVAAERVVAALVAKLQETLPISAESARSRS